jgi:microcystin-dependent protein
MKKLLVAALIAGLGVISYFLVPPPQRAHAQLSASQTWLGTAGGSANAITVAVHSIGNLSDVLGVPLRFLPSTLNTGATTITITLDSGGTTSTVALDRPTSNLGLQPLAGGELSAAVLEVIFDGTEFVINSPIDMTPVGAPVDFRGSAAPRGTLLEDGSCYAQSAYPSLFSVIGTTYNAAAPVGCSGSQFAVPYSNGTAFVALDAQGAHTANRITSAGSGCNTTLGTPCGSQNVNIIKSGLPNITYSAANSNLTDPGHSHVTDKGNGQIPQAGAGASGSLVGSGNGSTNSATTGISIPLNGGVTQTPTTTLPPILPGLRAIKY